MDDTISLFGWTVPLRKMFGFDEPQFQFQLQHYASLHDIFLHNIVSNYLQYLTIQPYLLSLCFSSVHYQHALSNVG